MPHIIASRNDGLGERLNSAFNAIVLSHATGIDYALHWPASTVFKDKHHAVTHASEIFSSDWLAAYEIPSPPIDARYIAIKKDPGTPLRSHLESELLSGRQLVPQGKLPANIFDSSTQRDDAYAAASLSFPFSQRLREIRDNINRIQIPKNLCAVHIRAGDVIYGQHSEAPSAESKFICATTIPAIARAIKNSGGIPILLGQEPETIRKISIREKLPLANSLLPPGQTPLENALSDIFLMARCNEIFSGNSGFARFASHLGNVPLKDPFQEFDAEDLMQESIIECQSHSTTYSPEQLGRTYFSQYFRARDQLSMNEADRLLSMACHLCPQNNMFRFYRAINAYRHNNIELGDGATRDLLAPLFLLKARWAHKSRLVNFLRKKIRKGHQATFFKAERLTLESAAQSGSSYARFLLLCLSETHCQLNEYLQSLRDSPLVAEYAHFVSHLTATLPKPQTH